MTDRKKKSVKIELVAEDGSRLCSIIPLFLEEILAMINRIEENNSWENSSDPDREKSFVDLVS